MWVLNFLVEVSDEELASMTSFGSSKSPGSPRTLTTVSDREGATVTCQSGPLNFSVINNVDRFRDIIVSTLVTVHLNSS